MQYRETEAESYLVNRQTQTERKTTELVTGCKLSTAQGPQTHAGSQRDKRTQKNRENIESRRTGTLG